MTLSEQMKKARNDLQSDKIAREKRLEEINAEISRQDAAKNTMMSHLRAATITDYLDWLSAYSIVNSSVFTHRYDYSFYRADFYVALNDFTITPLYGASSINIIVPEHVTVHGDVGHNQLYLHGEKPTEVGGCVPYFSDLDGDRVVNQMQRASVSKDSDCLIDEPTAITAAALLFSNDD